MSGKTSRNNSNCFRFAFVKNSIDSPQSHADLGWMVQLKTLFNAQLPKMGAEYITRLVFDPNHQNLALIRNCKFLFFFLLLSGRVIGGCCFRPFPDRKFVEIVFLAVSSHDQVCFFLHKTNCVDKRLWNYSYELHEGLCCSKGHAHFVNIC